MHLSKCGMNWWLCFKNCLIFDTFIHLDHCDDNTCGDDQTCITLADMFQCVCNNTDAFLVNGNCTLPSSAVKVWNWLIDIYQWIFINRYFRYLRNRFQFAEIQHVLLCNSKNFQRIFAAGESHIPTNSWHRP